MEALVDVLDLIGAIEWVGLGIFVFINVRKYNRKLDRLIENVKKDLEHDS